MRVVAEVGRGAIQHRLFHPVVGRFGDDGVGAARHMACQRIKPATVVLFQPAVNARTVKIKGKSAIQVFKQFPYLKKKPYWGNHFWAKGYCVDTVGVDAEMIRKYVKYQEKIEQDLES